MPADTVTPVPSPVLAPGGTDYTRTASQWYLLAVITFTYLVAFIDRGALQLLVQPIKRDLHLSDVQISLLLGLGLTLAASVLIIPAGYIVDRFNRRSFLIVSVIAWSIMTMYCGFVQSFGALLLGRTAVGVTEVGISPTGFSLIRSVFPAQRRGRAFALFSLGPAVAGGMALLLGGLILGAVNRGVFHSVPLLSGLYDWQVVLALYGLLGIFPVVLLLTLREPPRDVHRPAAKMGNVQGAAAEAGTTYTEALRHALRHWPAYTGIACFGMTGAMIAFSISAWGPAMIGRNWHLSPPQIGFRFGLLLITAAPLGAAITGYAIDWAARRKMRGATALVGFVTTTITGVLITIIPHCDSLGTAFALYAMLFLFYGSFYPIGATLLSGVTPARYMGKLSALYLLLQTLLGQAVAPTIVALVSRALFSGPRAIGDALGLVASVLSVLSLASLLIILLVLRRPQTQIV